MQSRFFKYLILISGLFSSFLVNGQFYGNNLAEYQLGGIPDVDTSFQESFLYNQLKLNYKHKNFKSFVELEMYETDFEERNYQKITRFGFNYKKDGFGVDIGNFNQTLGRGTLLRSFQVDQAVIEDISFRSKQRFYKDLLGVTTYYKTKKFDIQFLYGRPLDYTFPNTFDRETRRAFSMEALSGSYQIGKQRIGGALMRTSNDFSNLYSMIHLKGRFTKSLSYFVETSTRISSDDPFVEKDLDFENTRAIFANLTYSYKTFGLTAEYKNYKNFLLGFGINEPPAGVKQHTYRTLNRSTHIPIPSDEHGVQFEATYLHNFNTLFTANYTRTTNSRPAFIDGNLIDQDIHFEEVFFEISSNLGGKLDYKWFFDYSKAPFVEEENRVATGIYAEFQQSRNHIYLLELETQRIDRVNFLKNRNQEVLNHILALSYTHKAKLTIQMLNEFSNDFFLVTEDTKPIFNNFRSWIGGNITYKLNASNTLQIFAGNRRGGPACNAGICYEILDFRGVELRIRTKF